MESSDLVAPRGESAFRRLVRATDKRLLQAPLRAVSSVCDGACRGLDGVDGPLRAPGTRLVDATRTAVETGTGILRDVYRTLVEVPALFFRHAARSLHLARHGEPWRAVRGFGQALASPGARALGGGVDVLSRGLQGTVNAVLTLAFAEPPSRPLSPDEIQWLKQVYGDAVDFSVVRIKRGGATDWFRLAPHVVGNTVYMTHRWAGRPVFQPDGSFTREGLATLTHEMGHVWQNQNGGGAYIHRALWAQLRAFLRTGERHGAYAWRADCAAGLAFEELNPEQQATLVEEVGLALRDSGQVNPSAWKPPLNESELRYVLSAWAQVRRGEGC